MDISSPSALRLHPLPGQRIPLINNMLHEKALPFVLNPSPAHWSGAPARVSGTREQQLPAPLVHRLHDAAGPVLCPFSRWKSPGLFSLSLSGNSSRPLLTLAALLWAFSNPFGHAGTSRACAWAPQGFAQRQDSVFLSSRHPTCYHFFGWLPCTEPPDTPLYPQPQRAVEPGVLALCCRDLARIEASGARRVLPKWHFPIPPVPAPSTQCNLQGPESPRCWELRGSRKLGQAWRPWVGTRTCWARLGGLRSSQTLTRPTHLVSRPAPWLCPAPSPRLPGPQPGPGRWERTSPARFLRALGDSRLQHVRPPPHPLHSLIKLQVNPPGAGPEPGRADPDLPPSPPEHAGPCSKLVAPLGRGWGTSHPPGTWGTGFKSCRSPHGSRGACFPKARAQGWTVQGSQQPGGTRAWCLLRALPGCYPPGA